LDRSLRSSKPNTRQLEGRTDSDGKEAHCALSAALSLTGGPQSYHEALRSPGARKWKQAVEGEYNALVGSGTWELVEPPPGTNTTDSRWHYKAKNSEPGKV